MVHDHTIPKGEGLPRGLQWMLDVDDTEALGELVVRRVAVIRRPDESLNRQIVRHESYQTIHVVPREAHSRRGPRTSQTASTGVRPRATVRSLYPMRSLRCAPTVPARPPSHRPTNSPAQRCSTHNGNLPRKRSSGRGTLSFHLKRARTDLSLYLRTTLLEWDRQPTN